MASVRFESLHKHFGPQSVIAPLDLRIENGEFFTFVGPSGCGKSTLLNLIAGIEPPSGGRILFDDDAVTGLTPGERDVAMVFQSYALYPHLSVRENIAFPLRAKRLGKEQIERAVEEAARVLALEGLLDRKPRQLSGGQRQRVALGRALVRKPRLFLMDEPLSNLDAQLRIDMREELKRLHQAYAITTIYVTHDQEEAMALSDRMAVLRAGRIEQCATPQTIYQDPASLFVAQFIGSPPINVLQAQLLAHVPGLADVVKEADAADAVIGVRPADIAVQATATEHAIEAQVTLIEPTGSDVWIVGHHADQRLKGRAALGTDLRPGMRAFFRLPSDKLYAFDRKTGERLRPAGQPR